MFRSVYDSPRRYYLKNMDSLDQYPCFKDVLDRNPRSLSDFRRLVERAEKLEVSSCFKLWRFRKPLVLSMYDCEPVSGQIALFFWLYLNSKND
jgi:hypothetical protein